MSRPLLRSLILALVLVAITVPAQAQRPDPHHGGTSAQGTSVATPADPGCNLVEVYTRDLYGAIDDSGAFGDFFTSDADFGDVSASDAKAIIADGDALIETLKGLKVPPAYADAHAGILTFVQFQIDTARFYGLDTSVVPDIAGQERAFREIEAGEVAVAKACPAEIDKVGGYILLDPSTEESTPVDPNNPAD